MVRRKRLRLRVLLSPEQFDRLLDAARGTPHVCAPCVLPHYPSPQPYYPPPVWYWTTTTTPETTSSNVRCTCPPNRGDNFLGHCPIHDVQVTNTGGTI